MYSILYYSIVEKISGADVWTTPCGHRVDTVWSWISHKYLTNYFRVNLQILTLI